MFWFYFYHGFACFLFFCFYMILMKSAMSDDGCLFALVLVFFQFRNFYVLYIRSIISRVTKSKFMLNGGIPLP